MSVENPITSAKANMQLAEANPQAELGDTAVKERGRIGSALDKVTEWASGLLGSTRTRIGMAALMVAPAGACATSQQFVEDETHWHLGVGVQSQNMGADSSIAPFNVNGGVMFIDQGTMHGPDVNLAVMSPDSRILDVGYKFGIGPGMGHWHVFTGAGIGWANNNTNNALRLRVNLGAEAGIPTELFKGSMNNLKFLGSDYVRFYVQGGTSFILRDDGLSGDMPDKIGAQGTAGLTFRIKP